MTDIKTRSFTEFAKSAEPRLRRALLAAVGEDTAGDALSEALLYGWRHWDRVEQMENPIGYLYTVGRTRGARRGPRSPVRLPAVPATSTPWIEPGLPGALTRLPVNQRVAVVLVHCYQFTHAEAAEVLGISRSSLQNHVERGLKKLRRAMGVKQWTS